MAHDQAEGVRYAALAPGAVGTYLVDMNAMFFGMPMALFPAIAKGYGGAGVLGLLFAAPVGRLDRRGPDQRLDRARAPPRARGRPTRAAAWGVAIVGFGLADALWLALACLAVAGAMDTISGIFRSAIWNGTIPTTCAAAWPGSR